MNETTIEIHGVEFTSWTHTETKGPVFGPLSPSEQVDQLRRRIERRTAKGYPVGARTYRELAAAEAML